MSSFNNKNILVTGGANGIGRLLGLKSLREGARCLIVWDRDMQAMKRLKKECAERGWECITYRIDLTNTDEIEETARLVKNEAGAIDILFNNAGIVAGKRFIDHSTDEIRNTIQVNIEAVMLTTKAFLPEMVSQNSGHIITISSAASLMANPGMSVYASSKWAVSGWSESLRLELEETGSKVKVTTVQPSYIDTGMFSGVKPPLLTPLLQPDDIAEKIIRAVKKDNILLREPFMVKITPFLKGILPTKLFDVIAGKLFKVYNSMSNFKGRDSHE